MALRIAVARSSAKFYRTPEYLQTPASHGEGGSVAEWLATAIVTVVGYRAGLRRRRAWVQIAAGRRCRVTVLGKLFTPIVPLFTK